jgi:hypothetical protein
MGGGGTMRYSLLIGLMALTVWAGQPERSILLQWDASSSPDVQGYHLYYGEAPRQYTVMLDTGLALSASIGGLKPGQVYYFAATAVNASWESAFSNEVSSRARVAVEVRTP